MQGGMIRLSECVHSHLRRLMVGYWKNKTILSQLYQESKVLLPLDRMLWFILKLVIYLLNYFVFWCWQPLLSVLSWLWH